MSLGMTTHRHHHRPYAALIRWEYYSGCDVDGWMFRAPGCNPEPCPEDAWDLDRSLESIPRVARILAEEADLTLVLVQHPDDPRLIFVYTPAGGGDWRRKSSLAVSCLGHATVVKTLLEVQAA